jgi:hypothetical protein
LNRKLQLGIILAISAFTIAGQTLRILINLVPDVATWYLFLGSPFDVLSFDLIFTSSCMAIVLTLYFLYAGIKREQQQQKS